MRNTSDLNNSILTLSNKNVSSTENQITVYSFYRYCLLGIQVVIPTLMNLTYLPLTLFTFLCLLPDEPSRGNIIFSLFLCSGVGTILQAAVGIKFPVVISPSSAFISGTILFLKSPYWEIYSAGDLYAMGPSLRNEEYTIRIRELRGFLIFSSIVSSFACGFLWFLPTKLPSPTIPATLISVSLSNVGQILCEKETSMLSILAFTLSLGFCAIENIKIFFPIKITNNEGRVSFKILKQLSIFLSFIILMAINIRHQDNEAMLERALGTHQWYSFNLPLKGFTLPKLSTRSLVLLPFFCDQFITSYCSYQSLSKLKERHLKALLLEMSFVAISAGIGVAIPLSVDPTSIALIQMTKVKNKESSVIAGGLLILISVLVKIVALFSYIPYSLLSGLISFIYGQLLIKGLKEMKPNSVDIVGMSVLTGMVFSLVSIEVGTNVFYSTVGFLFKCPSVVTFFISILLSIACRTSNVQNK